MILEYIRTLGQPSDQGISQAQSANRGEFVTDSFPHLSTPRQLKRFDVGPQGAFHVHNPNSVGHDWCSHMLLVPF